MCKHRYSSGGDRYNMIYTYSGGAACIGDDGQENRGRLFNSPA